MPLLTKAHPYEVEREICWMNPSFHRTPGDPEATGMIRPRSLAPLLTMDGVRAVSCDLALTQGKLLIQGRILVWMEGASGEIDIYDIDKAPAEILRPVARFACSPEATAVLDLAAPDLDAEICQFYQAFYMPHCTIISFDDLGLALDDMEGVDPDSIDYGPSLSDLMGAAYAPEPQSNHAKMDAMRAIEEDLRIHTRIVSHLTGYQFLSK